MKKAFALIFVAFLLAACGDTVEDINQTGMEVVASEDDLPKCDNGGEGSLAYVLSENSMRVCIEGEWIATAESIKDSIDLSGETSCTSVKLTDGSGIKIVCNGDSVGVMLNGEKGADGADGKDGANGKNGTDGKDAVLDNDTLESDSEKVAVSFDSLVGYSQKGPFLKGSTVYLYELSDGRTLKQTNGNFTSIITRNDGRYKFAARDLVSQYAMIVVEGNYRNEVTGKPSDAAIILRAITNMRMRSDANINLLTTLEFDRVYHLVTRGDKDGRKLTVKQAKRQAQKEILSAFDIDTTGLNFSAEDLDVFGGTDADAALLAISIMMQRDESETVLTELLTEISKDMETDGKWDNDASKAHLADWAMFADGMGRLGVFRNNVSGWGLSDTVPEFEKFIRNFYSRETHLGICGSDRIPVGTVKRVTNAKSQYYAENYADTTKTKERFICADADSTRWRVATDLEKDTVGLNHEYVEGDVVHGRINVDSVYVFENGKWRHGTYWDGVVGKGCVPGRKDSVALGSDNYWYKCVTDTVMAVDESKWTSVWRLAESIEMDTATWGQDWTEGEVRNGTVNNHLTYVFQDGHWRIGTPMDSLLRQACLVEGEISDTVYGDRNSVYGDYYYVCTANVGGAIRGWVEVDYTLNQVYPYMDGCKIGGEYSDGRIVLGRLNSRKYVCDNGSFREAEGDEAYRGLGCVSYNRDTSVVFAGQLSHYICTDSGWVFDVESSSDSVEIDGRQYRTVAIEKQIWMAENLDVETENSFCYNDSVENCIKYGRLYTWDEATTLCPSGWHLPDTTEWHSLFYAIATSRTAGHYLKSSNGWGIDEYGQSENGLDTYGFSVLPGGYKNPDDLNHIFYAMAGRHAYFWSSTIVSYSNACNVDFYGSNGILMSSYSKSTAQSVRCIRNSN